MPSILAGSRKTRNLCLWTVVVSLAAVSAACDKLPLLAPQSSTIKLSSALTNVQANGTTEIRATVLEPSGTPVQNGTTVTFTTNLGAVTPTEARTLNGVATVQFVGNGQSGKASIRAISGGAASDPLELSVGAAAAGRVSVSASPTSVSASGGTTTVTAVVVDASGNPIAGVPVTFATSAGSLSASVVNTDTAGVARTTLTTNSTATVTVTAGGLAATTLTVAIAARPTVSISPVTQNPTEGSITTFTVSANPGSSGSPIQNVVINYGDGSSDELGSVTTPVTVQHIYNDEGAYTPTATATDAAGSSASASTVIVVQPIIVSITATQDDTVPKRFHFTANVTPNTAAVASYTWTFGDGSGVTEGDSQTSHTYSGGTSGPKTVRVTVRTSTNKTASGSTTVQVP